MFSGKGGVGKTVSSTSIALWYARHGGKDGKGIRTLVVSSDPAHSLGDVFEQKLSHEPTLIKGEDKLWAAEISAEKELEWLLPMLKDRFSKMITESFGGMDIIDSTVSVPGMDEAAMFFKLLQFFLDPNYQLIIFDTAPSGHTIRFLEMASSLENIVIKMLRFKNKVKKLTKMLSGGQAESGPDAFEKFQRMSKQVRQVISDPNLTEFVQVMIPEQMSVAESFRGYKQLEHIITCNRVIVNHIIRSHTCNCKYCNSRRDVQKYYKNEIDALFSSCDIVYGDEMDFEVKGLEALEKLGEALCTNKNIRKIFTIKHTEPIVTKKLKDGVRISLLLPYVEDEKDISVSRKAEGIIIKYLHVTNTLRIPQGMKVSRVTDVQYNNGYLDIKVGE